MHWDNGREQLQRAPVLTSLQQATYFNFISYDTTLTQSVCHTLTTEGVAFRISINEGRKKQETICTRKRLRTCFVLRLCVSLKKLQGKGNIYNTHRKQYGIVQIPTEKEKEETSIS